MPFPRFAWNSSITRVFQSAISQTNALEDCAIPARRRAECQRADHDSLLPGVYGASSPRCQAPWRDTDRVRSPAFVDSPTESIEHDPDELKPVPGTASHKGPRSLAPLRIPGFRTRIRYE